MCLIYLSFYFDDFFLYIFHFFHFPLFFYLRFFPSYVSHVIVNRQRHHNIRNGIVWVQTSHSTGT